MAVARRMLESWFVIQFTMKQFGDHLRALYDCAYHWLHSFDYIERVIVPEKKVKKSISNAQMDICENINYAPLSAS